MGLGCKNTNYFSYKLSFFANNSLPLHENRKLNILSIMKNLDWASLSFGYMPTDYNVRCYYRDGKWGEIEVCSDEFLKIHMAATCLHYGQEAFEGLKAEHLPGNHDAGSAYRTV